MHPDLYGLMLVCALRAGEIFMLQKEFIDFETGLLTWPSAYMAAGVKAGRIRVLMQPALKLLQIYFSFAPLPAIRIPRQLIQAYLKAKLGVTLASARHVGAHFAITTTNNPDYMRRVLGHATFVSSQFYIDFYSANTTMDDIVEKVNQAFLQYQ